MTLSSLLECVSVVVCVALIKEQCPFQRTYDFMYTFET